MKTSPPSTGARRALVSGVRGFAFLSALIATTLAQTPAGTAPTSVPELFVGELADVGPQYLLRAKPAARPFELWIDWEYAGTDNIMLEASHATRSTLFAAQTGLTWHSPPSAHWGGALAWEAGVRAQAYRYGFLANSNRPVNFIEIDRNNFDLAGAHAAATWQRAGWLVTSGWRGAALRSRRTGRRFYEELGLDAQCVRQWTPRTDTVVAAGFDAARRWTRTDSFGLLPPSWHDRVEVGLVASLERRLGAHWRLQPSVRLQATHYTHADHRRNDRHVFARLTLARACGTGGELRLSFGHEQRESSDPTINDYHKLDLALGGTFRWRF